MYNYICENKHKFDEPHRYEERHGLEHGLFEQCSKCPVCGADYGELIECSRCDAEIDKDYAVNSTFGPICERCADILDAEDMN